MYIIVGLGNPGQEYANTRHNVGFMVADRLKKFGLPKSKCLLVKPQTFMNRSGEAVKNIILENSKFKYRNSKQIQNSNDQNSKNFKNLDFDQSNVISAFGFRNSDLSNFLVIHDDLDLPIGTVRIKIGGSSAGHKGVQSIIDTLGSDQFWRIRVGIGKVGERETSEKSQKSETRKAVENYVLSPFDIKERSIIQRVVDQTAHQILSNLEKGGIVNETFRVS